MKDKKTLIIIRWIWDIYRPFHKSLFIMFGFIASMQLLTIITPIIYGKVINSIFLHQSLQTTVVLIAISFGIYVFTRVIDYVADLYELKVFDFTVQQHISKIVLEKNLSFSMGQHISSHSGVKQSIINRGQHSLTSLAFTFSYNIIPDAMRLAFIVSVIMYTSALIGSIILGGIVLFIFVTIRMNNSLRPKVKKVQTLWNRHEKLGQELITNIPLIQSHAQEHKVTSEFDVSMSGVGRFGRKLWGKYTLFSFERSFISIVTRTAIMFVGAVYVYRGLYLPGYLVMLLSWSSDVFGRLDSFGKMHRQVLDMYGSVQKLYRLYTLESEIKIIPNPVQSPIQGNIEFRNVSFSYPQRKDVFFEDEEEIKKRKDVPNDSKETIHHISFTINAGQSVAFVGPSGAGKTTIASLLLRAFDPTEGQIIVDGNDLRIWDLQHYRRNVGYVEQNVSLFDNTLRYNIVFGLNGKGKYVTQEQLNEISRMACVDKFYDKLEKGFDTLIGERGIWLSGGERQRVGIARALAKNPPIMIFDEATSNLDSQNESIIRESIDRASIGRTTIIIAHRLSTVRNADKILVFDQGSIVGEGTHEELLSTCVQYQTLVQKQVLA